MNCLNNPTTRQIIDSVRPRSGETFRLTAGILINAMGIAVLLVGTLRFLGL